MIFVAHLEPVTTWTGSDKGLGTQWSLATQTIPPRFQPPHGPFIECGLLQQTCFEFMLRIIISLNLLLFHIATISCSLVFPGDHKLPGYGAPHCLSGGDKAGPLPHTTGHWETVCTGHASSECSVFIFIFICSLVPRLSPHANEKSKGKGRAW